MFWQSTAAVSACIAGGADDGDGLETLKSVAASEGSLPEVVLVEDRAGGEPTGATCEWLLRHLWLPVLVLAPDEPEPRSGLLGSGPVECLLQRLHGRYIFPMAAGDAVYPRALELLVQELDRAPSAAFAYCMVEHRAEGRPGRLWSPRPWEERRQADRYLDRMVLLRREALALAGRGGEHEADSLWPRAAALGLHGAFVAEILGAAQAA